MDASEAPEVFGIGHYQKSDRSTLRLHGSIKITVDDEINADGEYQDVNGNTSTAEGTYRLNDIKLTGGAEWFYKFENAVLGAGLAINNGVYHHFTVGLNTEDMEFGAFWGFFNQMVNADFGSSSKSDEWSIEPFYGFYLGFFIIEKIFLNYSLSAYQPSFGFLDSVKAPRVVSHHFIFGYHLNKYFALNAGGVYTSVRSSSFWTISLGTSLYAF